MKQDATAVITQQFIDAIEGGMLEGKWVRPWQNTGDGFPTNALTSRPYSGTNAFMLLIAGGGQWATYKQWQERQPREVSQGMANSTQKRHKGAHDSR